MHLPGVSWVPATLCICTLVQSCRHATSLVLPAGVLWKRPTSCLQLSRGRSSRSLLGRPSARDSRLCAAPSADSGLKQPKRRRLNPEWVSRVSLLRGGADASVGVVPDESTDDTATNRSSLEDPVVGLDVGVGSSPAGSEEAAEDKRSERWLLKTTEHDRCVCVRERGPPRGCTWCLGRCALSATWFRHWLLHPCVRRQAL